MNSYELGDKINFMGRVYEVRGNFGQAVKLQPCGEDGKPSRGRPRNVLKAGIDGAADFAACKAAKGEKPPAPETPAPEATEKPVKAPKAPKAPKVKTPKVKTPKSETKNEAPVIVAARGPAATKGPDPDAEIETSGPGDNTDIPEVSIDSYEC